MIPPVKVSIHTFGWPLDEAWYDHAPQDHERLLHCGIRTYEIYLTSQRPRLSVVFQPLIFPGQDNWCLFPWKGKMKNNNKRYQSLNVIQFLLHRKIKRHLRGSGLDVVRYSPEGLLTELGRDFSLIESFEEVHKTPGGTSQQFIYCHFIRGRSNTKWLPGSVFAPKNFLRTMPEGLRQYKRCSNGVLFNDIFLHEGKWRS